MEAHKQFNIFLLLCLSLNFGYGQSQKSFAKLISETNEYLEKYSGLSPFGTEEFIALKKSGLPEETVLAIISDEDYVDGISLNRDSISEYNLLLEFQGLIVEHLTHIIAHEKLKDHKIEALLSEGSDLSIVVSDDRKLYNFSLAEKTGGTYRSRISITHYIDDSVPPRLKSKDDPELINQYEIFEGDGFDGIYAIQTEQETKYLLTGYVRGCSSCFEFHIMLVSLKDSLFEVDFSYGISTTDPEKSGINYDPKTKTITVDYITDALTADCDCSNYAEQSEEASYHNSNDDQELITKKCHCTFEFNGTNFELIKESWEKLKE